MITHSTPDAASTLASFEFLLVSADYKTLRAVTEGLSKLNAKLGCMGTTHSAKAYLDRHRLDGIIVDLEPSRALAFISSVRRASSSPTAVIFVCVTNVQESTAALHAGANLVLYKPLTSQGVVSEITSAQNVILRERRRYYRHPVNIPLAFWFNGVERQAKVTNISEGGMAVHVATPLARSSIIDFSFALPLSANISGRGQVAWANSEGAMGIAFHYLRGTGTSDLATWLSGRDRIRGSSGS